MSLHYLPEFANVLQCSHNIILLIKDFLLSRNRGLSDTYRLQTTFSAESSSRANGRVTRMNISFWLAVITATPSDVLVSSRGPGT